MPSPTAVNVIGKHNAYGLMYDARIVIDLLNQSGFAATFVNADFYCGRSFAQKVRWKVGPVLQGAAYRFGLKQKADLNIFLEWVPRQMFHAARRHVLIPNQEWFAEEDIDTLPRFDRVLCKTRAAEAIFRDTGARATCCGFTSLDRRTVPAPKKRREFLMITGNVPGLPARVLAVWARHPEWPRLTLSSRCIPPGVGPANVRLLRDFVPAEEILRLQNETLFHLCVTPVEGFGHKLVEALSCGAIVLAVDAPPMNEIVQPDRGLLVKWTGSNPLRLGTEYHFDEADLEQTVARAIALPSEQSASLSANARAWYEQNDRAFRATFPEIIRRL